MFFEGVLKLKVRSCEVFDILEFTDVMTKFKNEQNDEQSVAYS